MYREKIVFIESIYNISGGHLYNSIYIQFLGLTVYLHWESPILPGASEITDSREKRQALKLVTMCSAQYAVYSM